MPSPAPGSEGIRDGGDRMRTLIWMAVGCTVGVVAALALAHFGPHETGFTVAVFAAVWILIDLVWGLR